MRQKSFDWVGRGLEEGEVTETEQLGSACCGGKTTGSGIGSAQVQVPALQCSSSVVRHRAPISELLFSP